MSRRLAPLRCAPLRSPGCAARTPGDAGAVRSPSAAGWQPAQPACPPRSVQEAGRRRSGAGGAHGLRRLRAGAALPPTLPSQGMSAPVRLSGGVCQVMVGDRYFTDIVYGNRHGMVTVRTAPFTSQGAGPRRCRAA